MVSIYRLVEFPFVTVSADGYWQWLMCCPCSLDFHIYWMVRRHHNNKTSHLSFARVTCRSRCLPTHIYYMIQYFSLYLILWKYLYILTTHIIPLHNSYTMEFLYVTMCLHTLYSQQWLVLGLYHYYCILNVHCCYRNIIRQHSLMMEWRWQIAHWDIWNLFDLPKEQSKQFRFPQKGEYFAPPLKKNLIGHWGTLINYGVSDCQVLVAEWDVWRNFETLYKQWLLKRGPNVFDARPYLLLHPNIKEYLINTYRFCCTVEYAKHEPFRRYVHIISISQTSSVKCQ